jgi:hypothetical protein
MNLNLSLDDLRLDRYEATKELIADRLVKRRAVLTDPDNEELPATFVRTELLELMVNACGKKGVVVVRAPRGFGKTADAKFILKNSPGGIMFCNCQSTSTPRYWKGMASALGVPSTAYEKDSSWERLLADAVKEIKQEPINNERNTNTATWMESMIERLLTMCGGGHVVSMTGGNLNDLEPPSIEGLSLERLTKRKRGILILDDFNNVHSDDILFMKHFFPIVYARGVLTFVLVRDSSTADGLLNLNGWGRIFPLSGICTDEKNLPADEDGKVPLWRRPQWTREQLKSLVLSRFEMFANIDMMEGLAIRDGQNPLNVLERAEEEAQQASVL